MKIRRLSEIDLARIAPLPTEEKLIRLRLLKSGRPPHTYNPFRSALGDILNLQPELFAAASVTPWEKIKASIEKAAKTDDEARFNVSVAEALYDFANSEGVLSYRKTIDSWAVGYGQSVKYWWNHYAVVAGSPCFIFVDPRLSNPLTRVARKFVLSMMHERIRASDPDFAEANLVVMQFAKADEDKRVARPFYSDDADLFSFEDLNQMIGETYDLWRSVLEDREDESRRRPTGTNPFGF